MPRKRRRVKVRHRPHEFTPYHREHLLLGAALLGGTGYGRGAPFEPFDEELAREDWEEHRDELIAFWLLDPIAWSRSSRSGVGNSEPGGPGSRPWAWWAWDAPDDEHLVFGLAPIFEPSRGAMGVHYCRGVLIESQAHFLRRHGLLFPGEADRIPATAFEPVDTHWPEKARELELEAHMQGDQS